MIELFASALSLLHCAYQDMTIVEFAGYDCPLASVRIKDANQIT